MSDRKYRKITGGPGLAPFILLLVGRRRIVYLWGVGVFVDLRSPGQRRYPANSQSLPILTQRDIYRNGVS